MQINYSEHYDGTHAAQFTPEQEARAIEQLTTRHAQLCVERGTTPLSVEACFVFVADLDNGKTFIAMVHPEYDSIAQGMFAR